MIYLLRQMKSLSAYSSEKVSMSPPREQMQFVSNLILSKLVFLFSPVAHVDGFKGDFCSHRFSVCFHIGQQKVGIHCQFSKRTTTLHVLFAWSSLKKTNGKTSKDFITTIGIMS